MFNSWLGKISWIRDRLFTQEFLPGKSRGQRSLVGYIIHGGGKELDLTEQLNMTTQVKREKP